MLRPRGTHQRIAEQTVFLTINELGGISIIPASESVEGENYPIRLHRSGGTYELEVQPLYNVWVNGKNVSQHTLVSGELLEIGRNGPMLRFRIYPVGEAPRRTAANAFNDCIDCARYSDGSYDCLVPHPAGSETIFRINKVAVVREKIRPEGNGF